MSHAVGDLAKVAVGLNYSKLMEEYGPSNDQQTAEALRRLVADLVDIHKNALIEQEHGSSTSSLSITAFVSVPSASPFGDARLVSDRVAIDPQFLAAGLDADLVVDGVSEMLLAAKIFLGRLHGDVVQQKLDLIQFASGVPGQSGARPSEVLRGRLLNGCSFGAVLTRSVTQSPQVLPARQTQLDTRPSRNPAG